MKIFFKNSFDPSEMDTPALYSFLNPASIGNLFNSSTETEIKYFCDGILLAKLVGRLTSRNIQRVSFDFTSIAGPVFDNCQRMKRKVFLIGAEQQEIHAFVDKLTNRYPELQIVGFKNGYFGNDTGPVIRDILDAKTDVLIVGLGAGKQESFLLDAKNYGFNGIGFSCGGFIRQECYSTSDYYPNYINRLNLRFLYRMWKEPHTIKRYVFDYPRNIYLLIQKCMKNKIVLQVD